MAGLTSVLFPTTGRPERAVRCLENLRETAPDVQIVAAVDADPEAAQRIAPLVDILNVCKDYRGCSASWNAALALATGDPIVFAADDLVWSHGWLEAAEARLAEFEDGWGMVGFNDGHWDGNELATHYLMSRRFIVEVLGGRVAWECYKHSFNDLETTYRAKAAGRFAWAEDAVVTHEHWLFGTRPKDDTDTRRLPDHPIDQRCYDERRAAGFPDTFPPVITS